MEPRRSGASHNQNQHQTSSIAAVSNGGGILSTILTALLVIVAILGIVFLVSRLTSTHTGDIKGKQYQALFLTNGQVYFGHLSKVNNDYVKLTNIYYLQVQQQVQPGQQQNNSQQPNVSLAKLGNELHGPEDQMYVAKSQVLFWENLKDSGKVVQAIKQSGK